MGSLNRLIGRLHSVFNKDPKPVAAINIVASVVATVTVSDLSLVLRTGTETYTYGLATVSLSTLATSLSTIPGITATVTAGVPSNTPARAILEGYSELSADPVLRIASSTFYKELQTFAWECDAQVSQLQSAGKQLYLNTAEAAWLDTWGLSYFGIPRYDAETDAAYAKRIIYEVIAPNQNNKALENLITNAVTGFDCTVTDLYSDTGDTLYYSGDAYFNGSQSYAGAFLNRYGRFQVVANIEMEDPAPVTTPFQKITDLVNKHRAAGTKLDSILLTMATVDSMVMSDALTFNVIQPFSEVYARGLRYDGSINYDNGAMLTFNGANTYNGAESFNRVDNSGDNYNNTWDSLTMREITV